MFRQLFLCLSLGATPLLAVAAPTPNAAWLDTVSADIAQREYQLSDAPKGLQAPNRAQGFRTWFDAKGVRITRRDDGDALLRLGLTHWGRADNLEANAPSPWRSNGDQAERASAGLSESIRNSSAGLAQEVEVLTRPAGSGELLLELRADSTITATGKGYHFSNDAGSLGLSAMQAVDADGEALALRSWLDKGSVMISVADQGARYPVTIKTLITGNADAILPSGQGSGASGVSLAFAGDLNGDGFGDVAVGASGFDLSGTNAGAVFVYFGAAGAFNTTADGTLGIGQANARLGSSVAAAGDLNGDGFGDLIVGSSDFSSGQAQEGAAYIFFGGAGASFNTIPEATLEGGQAGAFAGGSVAGVGDVNGDGFADVAVGLAAYDNNPGANEGRVFVYFGAAGNTFDITPDVTTLSFQAGAAFGASVAGGGDINADGFADFVVGALLADNGQTDEGIAYVYFGGASVNSVADAELESNVAGAQLGASVAVVGDVNGDGFADVLVGAPNYSNPQTNEGAAFLYFGGAGTTMNAVVDVLSQSDQANAEYGRRVAGAGDTNGDGFADVLIGAPLFDTSVSNQGAAFLFLGGPGVMAGLPNQTLIEQTNSNMGSSLGGGDLNRDGFSDVIVGASAYDGTVADEGAAFIYFGGGRVGDAVADQNLITSQASAQLGHSVATGDFNGDGNTDVAVGAFGFDGINVNSGAVFLYLGTATGLSSSVAATFQIPLADDARLGASVAIGDLNDDGFDDVLAGAPFYNGGATDSGSAFIYYGGTSIDAGVDVQLTTNQDAQFGASVAVIGDTNGDGFNDLAVGAPVWDSGEINEGAAFIFMGGGSTFNTGADSRLEIDQASAFFGVSVAGAGDVNGDGYADVVVGGNGYDATGATNSGIAQVFLGGPTYRLDPTADGTFTAAANSRVGASVGSAGDFNGDGFADVIVGANEFSGGQATEGAAFVFYGAAGTSFNTVADLNLQVDQATALFGSSVAGGYDINGDGFGDVIVGAPAFSNGQAGEGAAFIYLGGATPDALFDQQLERNQASSRLGFSVALGDVNGDGFADALLGAPSTDSGDVDAGATLMYFGNARGRDFPVVQLNSLIPSSRASRWALSDRADAFNARFDYNIQVRERGRVEIEACAAGVAFGSVSCTRSSNANWFDLGNVGSIFRQIGGLTNQTGYKWRLRTLRAPFTVTAAGVTAPTLPPVTPWKRLDATTGTVDIRVSDLIFRDGYL